jgi:hypothetical protein
VGAHRRFAGVARKREGGGGVSLIWLAVVWPIFTMFFSAGMASRANRLRLRVVSRREGSALGQSYLERLSPARARAVTAMIGATSAHRRRLGSDDGSSCRRSAGWRVRGDDLVRRR